MQQMARTTFCRVGGRDDLEVCPALVVFIQLLYLYNYRHVNKKPGETLSSLFLYGCVADTS